MIVKKISVLLLLILTISFAFNIYVSNASYGDVMAGLVGGNINETDPSSDNAAKKANTLLVVIINIIRVAGVCVAIVMLLAVAMKYMTAAAGEKADIKKSAIQYVVGAIVLFGAVGILGLINDFSANIKFNGAGG